MYIAVIVFNKAISVENAISILEDLGCLWSIRESEVTIISNSGIDLPKVVLALMRASEKKLIINSFSIINLEDNTINTIIHSTKPYLKVEKLIKTVWNGFREVHVKSVTPLILPKQTNIVYMLKSPSNELISLNNLTLKKLIARRNTRKPRMYIWEAIYKLKFREAQTLKVLGILGIGENTFQGYGKFTLNL